MTKLLLGVMLWSVTHLVPGALPGLKKSVVARLGENGYKGLFTVLMVLAIYVLIGFILFFAPYPPNNVKRLLRHPQLTGVALWGIGHLLANGESRSIILFGGLAAWAIAEILLINRRDGARDRPSPVPARNDAILAGGGIVAYVVVIAAHEWLFGFAPFI